MKYNKVGVKESALAAEMQGDSVLHWDNKDLLEASGELVRLSALQAPGDKARHSLESLCFEKRINSRMACSHRATQENIPPSSPIRTLGPLQQPWVGGWVGRRGLATAGAGGKL